MVDINCSNQYCKKFNKLKIGTLTLVFWFEAEFNKDCLITNKLKSKERDIKYDMLKSRALCV